PPLDVVDEHAQRRLLPVRRLPRACRLDGLTELGGNRLVLEALPGAGLAERNPPAAAELDAVPFEDLDRGRLARGEIRHEGVACEVHVTGSFRIAARRSRSSMTCGRRRLTTLVRLYRRRICPSLRWRNLRGGGPV